MKKKNWIYIISFFCITYFLSLHLVNGEKVKSLEINGVPDELLTMITANSLNDEYDLKAEGLSKDSFYHESIGKQLYTTAMGNNFYSKNKLQLLKASKKHLLLAKKLRD